MDTMNKIIELLNTENVSQKDLMDYLGINKGVFTQWKNGTSHSYNKYLFKIAEFFNVSIDTLLNNTVVLKGIFHETQPEHICPICGYDYIHFKKTISANFDNEKSSGIVLNYFCEAGHDFYIVIEDYKGNSYMTYTDTNFNVIKPVIPQEYKNSINGENNVQAINSGNNSQVNINSSDSSMNSELLELFNNLPLIKKAEVILMINKMKEEK